MFLFGNFSLKAFASSVTPSILFGCIGSPPKIDRPSTFSFWQSSKTRFIVSFVNSFPPLKSCVSGLKQFLQLNVQPCTKMETLTPLPFEISIFLILLYLILRRPYCQYAKLFPLFLGFYLCSRNLCQYSHKFFLQH